jgi:hypothetical protein
MGRQKDGLGDDPAVLGRFSLTGIVAARRLEVEVRWRAGYFSA